METNTVRFAGDVKFTSALLTNYQNGQIEIIDLISRIDIFEDLYSPFVTAEVTIIDTHGLINKVPFLGEEILTLDITDGTGLGLNKKNFFVYKIKDRVFSSDKASTYVMCLISAEAAIDLNLKISKSYNGQPSEIAASVIKNLGFGQITQYYTEPSKTSVQFIANYWSPLEILNFLCKRSVSKATNAPTYLFYETLRQFNFVSQDMLVTNDATSKFTFSNRINQDTRASFERINTLRIETEFDYIERVKTGMYGNRLLLVNPASKTYNYRYLDFTKSFKDYNKLNVEPIVTDVGTRGLNTHLASRVAPTGAYSKMPNEGTNAWLQQRQTLLASRNAQNIEIDVQGRFNINVGEIADVYIFSEAPDTRSYGENQLENLLDRLHSGRHIVTSIRHSISRTEAHTMIVGLSKDSRVSETDQKLIVNE